VVNVAVFEKPIRFFYNFAAQIAIPEEYQAFSYKFPISESSSN